MELGTQRLESLPALSDTVPVVVWSCLSCRPVSLLVHTACLSLLVLAGCASFEGSVQVAAGRRSLIVEDYAKALSKFQQAAELEPGYVTTFTPFPENIWTYIGRSYYGLGDLGNARKALNRSVREHPDAILGHIYLGIVQMREGQVRPGLVNADKGLRLLKEWFRVLDSTDLYSCYWDPSSASRNETTSLLGQIRTRETPWPKIASALDWLGKEMEREIDLAPRDIDLDNFLPCR